MNKTVLLIIIGLFLISSCSGKVDYKLEEVKTPEGVGLKEKIIGDKIKEEVRNQQEIQATEELQEATGNVQQGSSLSSNYQVKSRSQDQVVLECTDCDIESCEQVCQNELGVCLAPRLLGSQGLTVGNKVDCSCSCIG